jgi:hypothetical protein
VGDDLRLEMRSSSLDVDQRSTGRSWTLSIVWSTVAALFGVASLSGFFSAVLQPTTVEAASPASRAGECVSSVTLVRNGRSAKIIVPWLID